MLQPSSPGFLAEIRNLSSYRHHAVYILYNTAYCEANLNTSPFFGIPHIRKPPGRSPALSMPLEHLSPPLSQCRCAVRALRVCGTLLCPQNMTITHHKVAGDREWGDDQHTKFTIWVSNGTQVEVQFIFSIIYRLSLSALRGKHSNSSARPHAAKLKRYP